MEVIRKSCEDHPLCPHGPCLMFERYSSNGKKTGRKFYACSACRDRSECSFFQWVDDKASKQSSVHWQFEIKKAKPPFSEEVCKKRLDNVKKLPVGERNYCKTCSLLLLPDEIKKHVTHEIHSIADSELIQPSCLFHPFQNNKVEAQYFFTKETTAFMVEMMQRLDYSKLVLIGAPKIHEYVINEKVNLKTFLMDIDCRYMQFFNDGQFCHYNMFNNHFFGGDKSKELMKQFLSESDGKKVALILDPPFGGLIDAISDTLQTLSAWWRDVNSLSSCEEIPLLWCFPYFNERRIVENLPHLKMMDYKVSYSNHKKFRRKTNKNGSPVRIFTNIKPSLFVLPDKEGYKFCSTCERYVSQENEHCNLCNSCATKHGTTYKHCILCEICVKNSYEHCEKCQKCMLATHNCNDVLKKTTCFICSGIGHRKRDCPQNDSSQIESKKRRKD